MLKLPYRPIFSCSSLYILHKKPPGPSINPCVHLFRFLGSPMNNPQGFLHIPYAPCLEYLVTFGSLLGQMSVNIPYMEHMGMWCSLTQIMRDGNRPRLVTYAYIWLHMVTWCHSLHVEFPKTEIAIEYHPFFDR